MDAGLSLSLGHGEASPRWRPSKALAGLLIALLIVLGPARRTIAESTSADATERAGGRAVLTISDAESAALEGSAAIADARASVEAARLALAISAPWRSSKLVGTGDLAVTSSIGNQLVKNVAPDFSWNLRATAPVLNGLSLDGSVSASAFQAGASVKPLANPDLRAEDNLKKALILAVETVRQTVLDLRAVYRAAYLASLDLGIKRRALEATEARAEAAALNAASGAATQAEVIDADSKRIDALGALLDATDRSASTLAALSRLVGRTISEAELADPDPEAQRSPMTKEAYLASRANLASLEIDLSAARRSAKPVMPELAISGAITQRLDLSGSTPSWDLSASLSLDPDTFLRDRDRASALDLERSLRKAAESKKDAAADFDALLARIAAARSALETANRIVATARLSFEKNSYLAESGTVSGTSLIESRVSLLSAEYRVAKARADLGAALDALDETTGT
ncbi:MAG: TolC family protein, partial [Spirochaetota bacterium]